MRSGPRCIVTADLIRTALASGTSCFIGQLKRSSAVIKNGGNGPLGRGYMGEVRYNANVFVNAQCLWSKRL